jgi:hypothetical protein
LIRPRVCIHLPVYICLKVQLLIITKKFTMLELFNNNIFGSFLPFTPRWLLLPCIVARNPKEIYTSGIYWKKIIQYLSVLLLLK